jgi:hypothetical protein
MLKQPLTQPVDGTAFGLSPVWVGKVETIAARIDFSPAADRLKP